MTDDQIREWCYRVWPTRWKELAPSSDSRALFLKETIKLKPDEDELKRIELAIVAQTKHWRLKSKVEKVYGIPRLSQWIKDRRFDDEFIDESAASIQERMDARICQCGRHTHGPAYDKCTDCLHREKGDTWKNHRIHALKKLGLLDEESTYQDVIQVCRDRGSAKGKFSLKHLLSLSNSLIFSMKHSSSNPSNTEVNTGSEAKQPIGSREWFEQHHSDEFKLDYDRETGLQVLKK